MALTYLDWGGNSTYITVPIPCLNKSHMFAYPTTIKGNEVVVGDVALNPKSVEYEPETGFCTFIWENTPNRSIRFVRSTPYTRVLHDFGNGTVFNLPMYIEQQKQMLYLWQESVETKNLVSTIGTSDCSVVEQLWKTKYERDVQEAFTKGTDYNSTYALGALGTLDVGTAAVASALLGVSGTSRVPVPDFNSAYVGDRAFEQSLFGYMQNIQTAPTVTTVTIGDVNLSVSSGKEEAQDALVARARALLGDKFKDVTVSGTTVTSTVASTLLERMLYAYANISQNPETVRVVATSWEGEYGSSDTPSPPEPPKPPSDKPFVLPVSEPEYPELEAREALMTQPVVDTIQWYMTEADDLSLATFISKYEEAAQLPSNLQWYSGSLLLSYLAWLDEHNPSHSEAEKVKSYAKKKLQVAGIPYEGSYVTDMVDVQEPQKKLFTAWYLLAGYERGGAQGLYSTYKLWYPSEV